MPNTFFQNDVKKKKSFEKVIANILLAYLAQKSKVVESSTLWSIYSVLKATIHIKHNTGISKFNISVLFLIRMSDNYKRRKSKTYIKDEIS